MTYSFAAWKEGKVAPSTIKLPVNPAKKQDEPATPQVAPVKIGGSFEVKSVKGIAYYDGKDVDPKKHKLDLYLPKGHKNFPVLFFIHGGGWTTGDRWQYGLVGQVFAKNGIGTVVISYRLSPAVQHPGHIEDVCRAFAWTHRNIKKYGGRPDQIFVSGQSAGGHLAALLGTNDQFLKAQKLSLKAIKGVVPISGIYTFRPGWMERVIGKGQKAAESASPAQHLSGKKPPFLIIYAAKDFPGCDKMSRDFCAGLKKNKNVAETMEIKERNHITIMLRLMLSEADPTSQALLGFIAKHSGLKLTPREQQSK